MYCGRQHDRFVEIPFSDCTRRVKEKIFDKKISKLIDTAYRLREKADYQDFIIISREQALEQIEKAEQVLEIIEPYLKEHWEK